MRELLFDIINEEKILVGAKNERLFFKETTKKIADKIVVKNHYSHKATSNSFCSLLINDGLGVIQLGYGIRPQMKGLLADICVKGNYCEFDRMWLDDLLPKYSESTVIGLLIFYMKYKYPEIKYMITYADESAGNKGTIYKATNAIELEGKEVDFYILENGERVHPVTMWHRHGTRKFCVLQEIYPKIIRVRGDNVEGNVSKKVLDSYRGLRQKKFIYGIDKQAKKTLNKKFRQGLKTLN